MVCAVGFRVAGPRAASVGQVGPSDPEGEAPFLPALRSLGFGLRLGHSGSCVSVTGMEEMGPEEGGS